MKGFSAHHTCLLKFPLFPPAYFLPVLLYLPFSFRNSFHSLLYSMMLLASGALYSNLFHMLIILCVKEFCLLFSLFPTFKFSDHIYSLLWSWNIKSLLGSILSIHLIIFKTSVGLHEVFPFPLRICSTFPIFSHNLIVEIWYHSYNCSTLFPWRAIKPCKGLVTSTV